MFFCGPQRCDRHLVIWGSPLSDCHGVSWPRKGNLNRSWSLTWSPHNIWKPSSAGSDFASPSLLLPLMGIMRRRRVQLISWKCRSQVRAALIAAASALLQRDRLVSRGQRHAGSLPHGGVLPVKNFISKSAHQSTHWNVRHLPLLPPWPLSDSCSWQVLWLWHNIRADGRLTFNHFAKTAASPPMLCKHLTSELGQWWALAAPERG